MIPQLWRGRVECVGCRVRRIQSPYPTVHISSWGWRVRPTPGAEGTALLLVGPEPTRRRSARSHPAWMTRLKRITAHRAHQSSNAKIHTLGNETNGDTILPMEVLEERMLATCEKRRLSATAKLFYVKRLTIVLTLVWVLPIVTLAQTVGTNQNPPTPLGKLVDVGDYRVHLYCTGTGSPTVVIVGAGFSFNWGLVQPEVAKFTQVCSYDHSGIGWSESGPKDSCSLR